MNAIHQPKNLIVESYLLSADSEFEKSEKNVYVYGLSACATFCALVLRCRGRGAIQRERAESRPGEREEVPR